MKSNLSVPYPLSETFAMDVPSSICIKGKESGTDHADHIPELNPEHRFDVDLMRELMAWFVVGSQLGDSLLITGPTGCGKSSVVNQIAARLKWGLNFITGYPEMQISEIIGSRTIVDGDVLWQDGPLTIAMRYGHIFLFDEMDMVSPSIVAALGAILEGRPLVLGDNGGEVVKAHPDFRFIFTGNSNGSGDDTGAYQGVFQQNMAMMDRCTVVKANYMKPDAEAEVLLSSVANIAEEFAKLMVNLANDIRAGFMSGELTVTCSTRTLIRWATYAAFFLKPAQSKKISSVEMALPMALGNRAKPEELEALTEYVQRIFRRKG